MFDKPEFTKSTNNDLFVLKTERKRDRDSDLRSGLVLIFENIYRED